MNMSPEINELAKALAIAQAEVSGAHKDSTNPHFKSKYADLESVWDACRIPLTKNGLSIVQTMHKAELGTVLRTMLLHTSGQFIFGETPLIMVKNDMQGLVSCVTYARRVGLSSIVGIAPTDDDGEAAVGRGLNTVKQRDYKQEIVDLVKSITVSKPEGVARLLLEVNEQLFTSIGWEKKFESFKEIFELNNLNIIKEVHSILQKEVSNVR